MAVLDAHLATCGECRTVGRQTAAIQRAIRRLAAETELKQTALPSIDFRARRTIPWRPALAAAAAALVICAGTWLATSHLKIGAGLPLPPNHDDTRALAPETRTPEPETRNPSPDPRSLVRVRFEPASDVIAVPVETANPNVTIIWVYPTVRTAEAPDKLAPQSSLGLPRSES
jgi:hypothetical protein